MSRPEGAGATSPSGSGPGQGQPGAGPSSGTVAPLTRKQLREQAAAQAAAAEVRSEGANTQLAQLQAVSAAREAAAREAPANESKAAQSTVRRAEAETKQRSPISPFIAPDGQVAPQQGRTAAKGAPGSQSAPDTSREQPSARPQRRVPQPTASAQEAGSAPTHGGQPETRDQIEQSPIRAVPWPVEQPAAPLSRRALREQAAARAAAEAAAQSAMRPASQPAPIVAPPAVTGAIRALDETGQLTPVQPVSIARPDEQPAQMSRPTPPVPQRKPLGAHGPQQQRMGAAEQDARSAPTARSGAGAPTGVDARPGMSALSAPTAGSAVGVPAADAMSPNQPGAFRVGVRDSAAQVKAQSEPRVFPQDATTPNPAAPSGQRAPLFTDAPSGWAPVSGDMPTQTIPAQSEEMQPVSDTGHGRVAPVPQWGSVQTAQEALPAVEDAEPFDEDGEDMPSKWQRYTPLQYVVLVVIGLVLGILVWQLINPTKTAEEPSESAPASTSSAPDRGSSGIVLGDL